MTLLSLFTAYAHVLGAGSHVICISNSHWTQYLGSVTYIDILSKIQLNKATLYIEQLQKSTKEKNQLIS